MMQFRFESMLYIVWNGIKTLYGEQKKTFGVNGWELVGFVKSQIIGEIFTVKHSN